MATSGGRRLIIFGLLVVLIGVFGGPFWVVAAGVGDTIAAVGGADSVLVVPASTGTEDTLSGVAFGSVSGLHGDGVAASVSVKPGAEVRGGGSGGSTKEEAFGVSGIGAAGQAAGLEQVGGDGVALRTPGGVVVQSGGVGDRVAAGLSGGFEGSAWQSGVSFLRDSLLAGGEQGLGLCDSGCADREPLVDFLDTHVGWCAASSAGRHEVYGHALPYSVAGEWNGFRWPLLVVLLVVGLGVRWVEEQVGPGAGSLSEGGGLIVPRDLLNVTLLSLLLVLLFGEGRACEGWIGEQSLTVRALLLFVAFFLVLSLYRFWQYLVMRILRWLGGWSGGVVEAWVYRLGFPRRSVPGGLAVLLLFFLLPLGRYFGVVALVVLGLFCIVEAVGVVRFGVYLWGRPGAALHFFLYLCVAELPLYYLLVNRLLV